MNQNKFFHQKLKFTFFVISLFEFLDQVTPNIQKKSKFFNLLSNHTKYYHSWEFVSHKEPL